MTDSPDPQHLDLDAIEQRLQEDHPCQRCGYYKDDHSSTGEAWRYGQDRHAYQRPRLVRDWEIQRLISRIRELEATAIVIPEIPFPGGTSQAEFWETAARNLEQNYPVGGSNLRASLARLAREAARVLRGQQ